jgi:hypothetical protein
MRAAQHLLTSRLAALLLAAVTLVAVAGRDQAAHADRISELTTQLSSSSEKSRLAAVTSLARLGDKKALKALVGALSDPNARVRSVAAAGLGKLGHKAALPALTAAAKDDVDADVRARAKEAAQSVAKAAKLPDPFAVVTATPPAAKPDKVVRSSGGRAGFGNEPRALEAAPEVYVLVNSSTDDSPGGRTTAKERKVHEDVLKAALTSACRSHTAMTTVAADAKRLRIPERHIDISVTKLTVTQVGTQIEIEAQLRLAISDDDGKMLSFLSGGAKVQVPKRTFNAKYLPGLRKEALESALTGMFDKLVGQLRTRSSS